jgi:predicted DNA-binding WGR domain protein
MLRTLAHLEARDSARNIARAYQIAVGQDLFGQWLAVRSWGRIGTRGQSQQVAVADREAAIKLARRWLDDRKRAPKRIGVAYRARR